MPKAIGRNSSNKTAFPTEGARIRLHMRTLSSLEDLGLRFAIATALYVRDQDPGARVLCVEGKIIRGWI